MQTLNLTEDILRYATPAELSALNEMLQRAQAMESPLDYACYMSPTTIRYPHIELINEYIVALCEYRLYHWGPGPPARWFYETRGGHVTEVATIFDIPIEQNYDEDISPNIVRWWGEHPETAEKVVFRLGVNMPPRHGKSWLITQHLPGWYHTRYPNRHVAVTTYSDDFSFEWGSKIQEAMESDKALFRYSGNRTYLKLVDFLGEIRFAGVGGKLTGTGYSLGIIDDPFKNADEAQSDAERERKDGWYGSTFKTRKSPIAVEIMMYTRWHEDDLAGRRIYGADGDVREDWCLLVLKAIATEPDIGDEDDPLGREPGEALCPGLFNIDQLLEAQIEDPLWFDAQYQADPSVGAGKTIDVSKLRKFRFVGDGFEILPLKDEEGKTSGGGIEHVPVTRCFRFATADFAASLKKWADWTVFSVYEYDAKTNTLFHVAQERERVEASNHIEWIYAKAEKHGVKHLGIENKTFGLTVINTLIRDPNIHVYSLEADSDKLARALPLGRAIGQGKYVVPLREPWVFQFTKEAKTFPKGRHDDQVDAAAYAMVMRERLPGAHSQPKNPADILRSSPEFDHVRVGMNQIKKERKLRRRRDILL